MRKNRNLLIGFTVLILVVMAAFAGLVFCSYRAPLRNGTDRIKWESRFDSNATANETVIGIETDSEGNAIIAGNGFAHKVNSESGEIIWATRFPALTDSGYVQQKWTNTVDFCVDQKDNIFVIGTTIDGLENSPLPVSGRAQNIDVAITKIDGQSGGSLWTKSIDGGDRRLDFPGAITVDNFGNPILCFSAYNDGSDYRVNVMKLSSSDGATVWWNKDNIGVDGIGRVIAMKLTSDNTVLLFGSGGAHGDYWRVFLAKIESNAGKLQWNHHLKRPESKSEYPVAFDTVSDGAIFLLCHFDGNAEVRKIEPQSGNVTWQSVYDSGLKGGDFPSELRCDQQGNAVATGWSLSNWYGATQFDTWCAKWDGKDGTEKWRTVTPLKGSMDQKIPYTWMTKGQSEILFGYEGKIIVCRTNWNGSNLDYSKAVYDPKNGNGGTPEFYDGPAHDHDHFSGAVMGKMGKVILTGVSSNCRTGLKPFKRIGYFFRTGISWDFHREESHFDDYDPYNYDVMTVKWR